jgi:hypothetical protein
MEFTKEGMTNMRATARSENREEFREKAFLLSYAFRFTRSHNCGRD